MIQELKGKLEATYSLLAYRINALVTLAGDDSLCPRIRSVLNGTVADLNLVRDRMGEVLRGMKDMQAAPGPRDPQQTEYPTGRVTPLNMGDFQLSQMAKRDIGRVVNKMPIGGILAGAPGAQIILPTQHGGEPIHVNATGGKQTYLGKRFDLVPPRALDVLAGILFTGAEKYGEENWRNIPVGDNVNHAINHLYKFLAGDGREYHLGNAACRALFALELDQVARGQ